MAAGGGGRGPRAPRVHVDAGLPDVDDEVGDDDEAHGVLPDGGPDDVAREGLCPHTHTHIHRMRIEQRTRDARGSVRVVEWALGPFSHLGCLEARLFVVPFEAHCGVLFDGGIPDSEHIL